MYIALAHTLAHSNKNVESEHQNNVCINAHTYPFWELRRRPPPAALHLDKKNVERDDTLHSIETVSFAAKKQTNYGWADSFQRDTDWEPKGQGRCVELKAQEKCDDDLMLTLVLLVLVELDIPVITDESARSSRPRIQANVITCYNFITFLLLLLLPPLLLLLLLVFASFSFFC